jgi:hypothetical protein
MELTKSKLLEQVQYDLWVVNVKTLQISIIAIACIVAASVIWYFTSYDPTPVTKENTFGIMARVLYQPAISCPFGHCPSTDFFLNIKSNSTAYLTGYNICDNNSCVKKTVTPSQINDKSNGYELIYLPADLNWNNGDMVDIQLEVSSTPDNKTALLLNLGNSTIVH